MSGVPTGGGGGDDFGGGGDDGGGGGKGGGGNDSNIDYSSPMQGFTPSTPDASSYAPTDAGIGSGSSLDSWLGNPTGNPAGGSGDFSTDFGSGDNLSGSGPVGGINGIPGAGGGSNTPMAFGGVESTGSNPSPSMGGAIDDFFAANAGVNSSTFGSSASSPAGASATSVAAPAGVAGVSDLSVPQVESTGGTPDKGDLGTGSGSGAGRGNGSSDSGGLMKSLGISPTAGTALGLAGLVNSLIQGNRDSAATKALQGQAATNNARAGQIIDQGQQQNAGGQGDVATGRGMLDKGAALQQYIATGTLPQGYEDQVQQAARDAKTAIISRYASSGQVADPNRNSVLAQELAQVDSRLPSMRETLASQLASSGNAIVGAGNQTIGTGGAEGTNLINSGLQAAGISSGIYSTLANLDQNASARQSQAIANFAAALNGTPRSVNLKVA